MQSPENKPLISPCVVLEVAQPLLLYSPKQEPTHSDAAGNYICDSQLFHRNSQFGDPRWAQLLAWKGDLVFGPGTTLSGKDFSKWPRGQVQYQVPNGESMSHSELWGSPASRHVRFRDWILNPCYSSYFPYRRLSGELLAKFQKRNPIMVSPT